MIPADQQIITNQPSAGQFLMMPQFSQGGVQYTVNPTNQLSQQGAIFPQQFSPTLPISNMTFPGSSWIGSNFIGIQDVQPISTFSYIRDTKCCSSRIKINGPDGKTLYRNGSVLLFLNKDEFPQIKIQDL